MAHLTSRIGQESRFVRRGSAKKGCLIALAVFVLLIAGVGIYIAFSWRGYAAGMMKAGTQAMVQQSHLPQDQKDRIIARANAVADDFAADKITKEQAARVMTSLTAGPLLPAAMISNIQRDYIAPSTLADDEKLAGDLAMQRLTRGLMEGKIGVNEAKTAFSPLTQGGPGHEFDFRPPAQVTPEQLRTVIASARKLADDRAVPDEPYTANFADEIDRAINEALAQP